MGAKCILYDNANSEFNIKATDGCLEVTAEGLEIRDEYHSIYELYEHRMALNIALFNTWNSENSWEVYKSKLHTDGSMFEGYFIVVGETPYGQISYHYKLEYWDLFRIQEKIKCDRYDGHSSQDVIDRLKKL